MSLHLGVKKLPDYLNLVDNGLKKLVPENIGGLERILAASGKRYRPSLVIAIAFYSGNKVDGDVIDAATAVELIHLASLVHDDIMDGGTVRHGVPTINSKEGTDLAIIAGDYLLAKGCALAAGISTEAAQVLAETIAALCEGQAIELNDRFNLNRTAESLISCAKNKTSSLFTASCVLGGLVAGLKAKQIKMLSGFAENLGVAYQLRDDVRDFVESPEVSGKSVGNDIGEGNYTLPVILSLQGPNKTALKKLLKVSNVLNAQVYTILERDDSINQVLREAENYKRKALLTLKNLENKELAYALSSFANSF